MCCFDSANYIPCLPPKCYTSFFSNFSWGDWSSIQVTLLAEAFPLCFSALYYHSLCGFGCSRFVLVVSVPRKRLAVCRGLFLGTETTKTKREQSKPRREWQYNAEKHKGKASASRVYPGTQGDWKQWLWKVLLCWVGEGGVGEETW